MSNVTLITCTGGRPKAFALCQRYVSQQSYTGQVQWIVVDDGCCPSPVTVALPSNITLEVLRPTPYWQPGQNTLARNMLAAIPKIAHDKILFIEDDDAYHRHYVKITAHDLDNYDIVGETRAHYYFVPRRKARIHSNRRHSSLCQTGIRRNLLPLLAATCQRPGHEEDWDRVLWLDVAKTDRMLRDTVLCVGMKGLPGRPGIGYGHRPEFNFREWTDDRSLMLLSSWIGLQNAALYREFMK